MSFIHTQVRNDYKRKGFNPLQLSEKQVEELKKAFAIENITTETEAYQKAENGTESILLLVDRPEVLYVKDTESIMLSVYHYYLIGKNSDGFVKTYAEQEVISLTIPVNI